MEFLEEPTLPTFTSWDGRPAVVLEAGENLAAFAKLEPGADWVEVDAGDVVSTASVMPESVFKSTFESTFGPLDLPTVDMDLD